MGHDVNLEGKVEREKKEKNLRQLEGKKMNA